MNSKSNETIELLAQLAEQKINLVDTLVDKGEEAAVSEPFGDLVEKAANYVPKSYIITDRNGTELVATLVDQETVFTATANDIREGMVAASDGGVVEGTKYIPGYITVEGYRKINAGDEITIPFYSEQCEYTKLQAIICEFNTDFSDSVSAKMVSIDSKVYNVNSTEELSIVTSDLINQSVKLNLTNNGLSPVLVRYFTYKEVE